MVGGGDRARRPRLGVVDAKGTARRKADEGRREENPIDSCRQSQLMVAGSVIKKYNTHQELSFYFFLLLSSCFFFFMGRKLYSFTPS